MSGETIGRSLEQAYNHLGYMKISVEELKRSIKDISILDNVENPRFMEVQERSEDFDRHYQHFQEDAETLDYHITELNADMRPVVFDREERLRESDWCFDNLYFRGLNIGDKIRAIETLEDEFENTVDEVYKMAGAYEEVEDTEKRFCQYGPSDIIEMADSLNNFS